jgi:hypothetical protein
MARFRHDEIEEAKCWQPAGAVGLLTPAGDGRYAISGEGKTLSQPGILYLISLDLSGMDNWLKINLSTASRCEQHAEVLTQLLEAENCGSVGGHDTEQQALFPPTGLVDRWRWLMLCYLKSIDLNHSMPPRRDQWRCPGCGSNLTITLAKLPDRTPKKGYNTDQDDD